MGGLGQRHRLSHLLLRRSPEVGCFRRPNRQRPSPRPGRRPAARPCHRPAAAHLQAASDLARVGERVVPVPQTSADVSLDASPRLDIDFVVALTRLDRQSPPHGPRQDQLVVPIVQTGVDALCHISVHADLHNVVPIASLVGQAPIQIKLCQEITYSQESKIITNQLIRSGSSVYANYRAANRARSKAEFFSKISIVVEEADETEMWLDLLIDSNICNTEESHRLQTESLEILKIMATTRKSLNEN